MAKYKKYQINIKNSCLEKWRLYKTYNNYKDAIKSMNNLAKKYLQVQLIKVDKLKNLEEEINQKVLDYAEEKKMSKYEAIVELIKLGLKNKNGKI